MKSPVWLLVALLLAGAMSACTSSGGDTDPKPTPSADAGLGDRRPAPTPTAALRIRDVDQLIFMTPSRNIGCDLRTDAVRCDIGDHRWTAPPKPADCELDWANGVYVERTGIADFMCAGDTLLGATTEILAYGHGLRAGDLLCDSELSALRCENEKTGHGFTLSTQDYDLF